MAFNPNDGTTLGTAEVISDEALGADPSFVRVDPNLPPTPYKVPRSKIAVGPYGQDGGDAAAANPLQTESYKERRIAENAILLAYDNGARAQAKLQNEYVSMVDARGRHIDSRGSR